MTAKVFYVPAQSRQSRSLLNLNPRLLFYVLAIWFHIEKAALIWFYSVPCVELILDVMFSSVVSIRNKKMTHKTHRGHESMISRTFLFILAHASHLITTTFTCVYPDLKTINFYKYYLKKSTQKFSQISLDCLARKKKEILSEKNFHQVNSSFMPVS